MKSHGRLTFLENPVKFLKIILSEDTQSTCTRMPEKFTKKHGKDLLDRVTLTVQNGDVWQVNLKKSKGDIWLQNGWGEFVEYYGVKFGHMLMFKYEGFSKFVVVIFNPSGSEIEYPYNNKDDHVKNNVGKDARKDTVFCAELKTVKSEDETWSEDEKHGIKRNDGGECSRMMGNKQRMEDARRALEKVKANFKCDKPFFMVYMYKTSVNRKTGVLVPLEFRKLLRRHKKNRTFLLQLEDDGRQKTWEVVKSNNYLGEANWLMFVKDNGITVGDICVFKLIRQSQNVLVVTILRSAA